MFFNPLVGMMIQLGAPVTLVIELPIIQGGSINFSDLTFMKTFSFGMNCLRGGTSQVDFLFTCKEYTESNAIAIKDFFESQLGVLKVENEELIAEIKARRTPFGFIVSIARK